ncbi:MAG: DUF2442 domain-containing protein [Nitrospira sp.]|nr:DUF2442 domain-containing protein [Nitrospira sp.]
MAMLRIREAVAGEGFTLRLTLSNGAVVERDIADLLTGPVFEEVRTDPTILRQVSVEAGTVVWPNGADLDPDVLIWGGLPPKTPANPPQALTLKLPSLVR